jgi:sugar lactone lactonase YvrE
MRTASHASWLIANFLVLSQSLNAEVVEVAVQSRADGESPVTSPFGIDFDAGGDLYFVELTGQRVRKLDRSGVLSAVAGTGRKGNTGDGGPAREAEFNGPHGLAFGPDGFLYVADTWNNRVRRIDIAAGRIEAFAGTGEKGFSGDGGPAAEARFGGVYGLAFSTDGATLYVADLDNRRVRAVDMKTSIVAMLAGNGERGVPADGGDARSSPLVDPRAVAADRAGNVYVLERSGHALRVVDRGGKIRTVAGRGMKGLGGDGGPAAEASFNGPKHLCVDGAGDVIIADTENHVIRKYLPAEGRVVRIAGSGRRGRSLGGGDATAVELAQPHGVFIDAAGTLFVADSGNDRILKISP